MNDSSVAVVPVASEFPRLTQIYTSSPRFEPYEGTIDVPDPTNFDISPIDFTLRAKRAWSLCSKLQIQTEIWRGRILRAVRDREARGVHEPKIKGSGLKNWVQDHTDISRSQAYKLIDLANAADALIASGLLTEANIEQFSKQSLIEAANAPDVVQNLIVESTQSGQRVTRDTVNTLVAQFEAVSSPLLPDSIKTKIAEESIPQKRVVPLVRSLNRLPRDHQAALQESLNESPDDDRVKEVTVHAQNLSKYLEAAAGLAAFKDEPINLEAALEEALRLDQLHNVAEMLRQAATVEASLVKLYLAWSRLHKASAKVFQEAGASTPNLVGMLQLLESLCGKDLQTEMMSDHDTSVEIQLQMLTKPL